MLKKKLLTRQISRHKTFLHFLISKTEREIMSEWMCFRWLFYHYVPISIKYCMDNQHTSLKYFKENLCQVSKLEKTAQETVLSVLFWRQFSISWSYLVFIKHLWRLNDIIPYGTPKKKGSTKERHWSPSNIFSKGQTLMKTESSLTALISWNVLDAERKNNKSFKVGP